MKSATIARISHRRPGIYDCLQGFVLALTLLSSGASSLCAQLYPLSANLWSNPEFKDRFLGSYGFDMERTPKITAEEQEVFKNLLPQMERNPATAAASLRDAINADSSAALDYTLGNLLVQARNIPAAIQSYQTAIRKFPNFQRAYKNLGLVLVNDGRYADALPHLRKALELSGADGSLYGPIGLVYLNLERPKLALTAYENALLFQPDSMPWRQGKLRCLLDIGRAKDAAALLEEMIAESPQEKNFWIWQANAFLSDQSIEQAAANLEIVKRMGKADAASVGLLGDIYLNRGMSELALENYLAAADLGTLSPERLLSTAQSLVSRQLWEQADTYLKETSAMADSLSQEQTTSYLNLRARVALGLGDLPAASEILNAVVAEDPMNGEALLSLGNLEREMENYEAAIFAYEQAAKIDETKVSALVEHARMLVGMRDYDGAVVVLRRAVVLEPGPRLETYLERVESAARAASGRI